MKGTTQPRNGAWLKDERPPSPSELRAIHEAELARERARNAQRRAESAEAAANQRRDQPCK